MGWRQCPLCIWGFCCEGSSAGGRAGEGRVQLGPWVDEGWDPGTQARVALSPVRTSGASGGTTVPVGSLLVAHAEALLTAPCFQACRRK